MSLEEEPNLQIRIKSQIKSFCSIAMSDSVTLWTAAYQVSLSMGFSRQEYWSGLPFPPPGDLPNSGMEPMSPASLALTVGFFTIGHQGFW